ncbi:MAG: hypothetical protein C5B55_10365 [Blastocatellia bacterium]|nr:MAG: hypothetical protein C5B55_10365 [Blastocatellia bacterium]
MINPSPFSDAFGKHQRAKRMLRLRRDQVQAVVAHAWEAAPNECCGLIGGDETGQAQNIYRLRNVNSNPETAYEAAPEELFAAQRQMRERNEHLLAIYHSHPRANTPTPSETDVRLAYYPGAIYLIVGLAGEDAILRAFEISEPEQSWHEVEYAILDE